MLIIPGLMLGILASFYFIKTETFTEYFEELIVTFYTEDINVKAIVDYAQV